VTDLFIGIDPGASAVIAIIKRRVGKRPILLGAWSIHGDEQPWQQRLDKARDELQKTLEGEGGTALAAIEIPAANGRTRKKMGPWTWLSMGWRAGRIHESVRLLGVKVETMTTGEWPQAIKIPVGKDGLGLHRIDEAGALVEGAKEILASMPTSSAAAQERAICCAEAILIAAAKAAATPWDK
jgi:hypothetical protein